MQTISRRTFLPVMCSNASTSVDVSVMSNNGGMFRAAIVPETIARNDSQLVNQLLSQQSGLSNFKTTVSMNDLNCGDRFVAVVEPISGSISVAVLTAPSTGSDGFGLYQTNSAPTVATESWWAKLKDKWTAMTGVQKGLIIGALVVIVLLIIWLIWKMMTKNKSKTMMSSPASIDMNYF